MCGVNDRLQVGVEVFHGEGGVLDCLDLIRQLGRSYQGGGGEFDPWRFGQAAQELAAEGVVVTEFPQTD